MENKGNGKAGIIILLLIAIGLGGYLGYHILVEDKNTQTKHSEEIKKLESKVDELTSVTKKDNKYTYSTLEGTYSYEKEIPKINDKATYVLTLNADGTFKYSSATMADQGYLGNYVIIGDEIKLNYMFKHGSDVSLTVATGEKTLKVENDTIIDNDPVKFDDDTTKVEMKKQKEKAEFNFNELITTVVDAGGMATEKTKK